MNYYDSVSASGPVAAAREITIGKFNPTVNVNLNANLNSKIDVGLIIPSYAFATPVFGGQLTLGMMGIVGTNHTAIDGTLTLASGPFVITRQDSISQTTTDVGDLYPQAIIRWNNGVNNWMVYGTGDIPVGVYRSTNLANIGIGHRAVDAGGGYTYFNPQVGHEFSAVTGFTYNLLNSSTNYQSGIDWHLWGASHSANPPGSAHTISRGGGGPLRRFVGVTVVDPPRQKPASFNLDAVLAMVSTHGGHA